MNQKKTFALGLALGFFIVALLAYVPALTDFDSGQFSTTGNKLAIASGASFTNISVRSPLNIYQKDTNSVTLRVFGFNSLGSATNAVQMWLNTPYPAGTPNTLGYIDYSGNANFTGSGNFGSGDTANSATVYLYGTNGNYAGIGARMAQSSNVVVKLLDNGLPGVVYATNSSSGSGTQLLATVSGAAGQVLTSTGPSSPPAFSNATASASASAYPTDLSTWVESWLGVGASTISAFGNVNSPTIAGSSTTMRGSNGLPRWVLVTNSPSAFVASITQNAGGGLDKADTNSCDVTHILQFNGPITSNFIWICDSPALPSTATFPVNTYGWRYCTGTNVAASQDSKWVAYSNDGITTNSFASSVTPATNTVYSFRWIKTGSNIVYYLNGNLVCTNNYLPPSTTLIGYNIQNRTTDVGITNLSVTRIDFVRSVLFHKVGS